MSLPSLQDFNQYFVPGIPRTPTNRYASIIVLRETKSYAIFTTEGGEQQDVEETVAGFNNKNLLTRLIMFKRKQVAPERRTGKALLRQYGVFPYAIVAKKNTRPAEQVVYGQDEIEQAKAKFKGQDWTVTNAITDCYLTEGLCTHCPDCLIYGYAAIEGEGARRARLMTDTSFSVRPYELIQKQVKFNVISEAEHTSGTITEYDYTTPGVFLPAVETCVDLTSGEFVYVLGNILRTTRYGKEGSRQGFVRNHVLAIVFSDVELFANLELTQAFYDAFKQDENIDMAKRPLSIDNFGQYAEPVLKRLLAQVAGRVTSVMGDQLAAILKDVRELNRDEQQLAGFLRELNSQSAAFIV